MNVLLQMSTYQHRQVENKTFKSVSGDINTHKEYMTKSIPEVDEKEYNRADVFYTTQNITGIEFPADKVPDFNLSNYSSLKEALNSLNNM